MDLDHTVEELERDAGIAESSPEAPPRTARPMAERTQRAIDASPGNGNADRRNGRVPSNPEWDVPAGRTVRQRLSEAPLAAVVFVIWSLHRLWLALPPRR